MTPKNVATRVADIEARTRTLRASDKPIRRIAVLLVQRSMTSGSIAGLKPDDPADTTATRYAETLARLSDNRVTRGGHPVLKDPDADTAPLEQLREWYQDIATNRGWRPELPPGTPFPGPEGSNTVVMFPAGTIPGLPIDVE